MSQLKAAAGRLPYPEKFPNQGPQGIPLASNKKHGLPLLVEKPAGQGRTEPVQPSSVWGSALVAGDSGGRDPSQVGVRVHGRGIWGLRAVLSRTTDR